MNSASPPAYTVSPEGKIQLIVMGNQMVFTETQLKGLHKVPKEIIIKRILPFVGGVRSEESRKTQLQRRLLEFLQAALIYCREWAQHSGPFMTYYVNLNVPLSQNNQDQWSDVKRRIDEIICAPFAAKRDRNPTYYPDKSLDFSAPDWLGFWILHNQITFVELALLPPIELLLVYMGPHIPHLFRSEYRC